MLILLLFTEHSSLQKNVEASVSIRLKLERNLHREANWWCNKKLSKPQKTKQKDDCGHSSSPQVPVWWPQRLILQRTGNLQMILPIAMGVTTSTLPKCVCWSPHPQPSGPLRGCWPSPRLWGWEQCAYENRLGELAFYLGPSEKAVLNQQSALAETDPGTLVLDSPACCWSHPV